MFNPVLRGWMNYYGHSTVRRWTPCGNT
ncbi:group II intron maturase-specific domain-containing protein [Pseudoxanthomonas sp. UTMC 1351]